MACQHVFYAMKECECNTDKPKNALKFDHNKRNADDLKLDADFVDGAVDPVANVTGAATVKWPSSSTLRVRNPLPTRATQGDGRQMRGQRRRPAA